MAKTIPIPSLKKPTAALPIDAMASFVTGVPTLGTAPQPEAIATPPEVKIRLADHQAPPNGPDTAPDALIVSAEAAPAAAVVDIESARPARRRVPARSGRRLETRRDGSVARKVTVYLEPELDRELSLHAVTNEVDRSAVVAEAVYRFLRKNDS